MNLKNVKDRLKYDTLDLSLCDLKEVPVREIATIRKATNLDLSNNLLTYLPNTFADLKHVVKLDLSKNMLTEIPENFGELRQLKHLDLYANQISRLPLSLSELKNLRWLDLKENPLTPAVASVAGPCSNLNECQACARNIVTYLSRVKLTIEEEKLRRLNTVTMNNEADTVSTKKAGKKKKKKQIDKSGKENLDKNGSNPPSETSATDEGVADLPQLTNDKKHAKEQCEHKENSCWTIVTMIAWLFLLCLVFSLAIVILPLYSKQSELFVNSIEESTGIPLKAFHKHATDMIYTCTRYAVNIYDKLYHSCAKNFQTDNEPDIPM